MQLMDSEIFLLTNEDLPKENPRYLTELSKQELEEYSETIGIGKIYGRLDSAQKLTRIFITLPLEIKSPEQNEAMFIPIPFIVDTGAPVTLILGEGAESSLRNKNLFCEDKNCLKGRIFNGKRDIVNPIVNNRADSMEGVWKDSNEKRANLLGLIALGYLEVDIRLSDVVKEYNSNH